MVIKWIKSVAGQVNAAASKLQDDEARTLRKGTKLIDVAHEAVKKSSATDQEALDGLVKIGWPNVQREQFKGKIRKKVWELVSDESGAASPEMVEEITERIADVAEVDPFYKKMFGAEKI